MALQTPPYSPIVLPLPSPQEYHDKLSSHPMSTPTSIISTGSNVTSTPNPRNRRPTFHIPPNLTQSAVEASPGLKRLQQDLLILTSLKDNSTLSWRPSWFDPPSPSLKTPWFWTLHNPPNVVTEQVCATVTVGRGEPLTRRMREEGEPVYLKTWDAWERYCVMYGVPWDFLEEGMVRLVRLKMSDILTSPTWPLYPEPPSSSLSGYILPSDAYTRLPRKFRHVGSGGSDCVVIHSNGSLEVAMKEAVTDAQIACVASRRWSPIPWTVEQEMSCHPRVLNLKYWNTAKG